MRSKRDQSYENWVSIFAVVCALFVGLLIAEARRKFFIVRPLRERRLGHLNQNPPKREDVVFLGDSLMHGAEWSAYFREFSVRNFGVAGDTTENVLKRLRNITEHRPQVIVLMAGTNDITAGLSAKTTIRNLACIIGEIREQSPQTSIILHTLLPRQRRYRRRIELVNDEIRTRLSPLVDALVDLHPYFVDRAGALRPEMTNDHLHLLTSGYRIWSRELLPRLTMVLGND